MAMVDQCFPGDANPGKEDFGPPLSGMPGQFPVYLRLPYRSDSYFCFKQEDKQAAFLSMLSDCIRHQNQDFLKKDTCEVQAFLKAVQLYRQDRGKYEAWDMLIGSDGRVMANLVMEQLLPSLQTDLLPRLKAKRSEKKRVWFATVEAAYFLVQEHLLDGLSVLKEECRTLAQQQEVLMHSDLDQILSLRRQLEDKIQEKVSEPAQKLCSESVQPYLGSVLEELMEPISCGFQEGRQLSERMMDQVCKHFLEEANDNQVKKTLSKMARPNLSSCYQKIGSLQDKLQNLQERFGSSAVTGAIHSAQIDLQQLMDNAAFTFEQLLYKAVEDKPGSAASAIEKAKHRVLKQYDYDSSTVRKRIFQEALVSVTLPFIKKNLADICKNELQGLDQLIYADYSNFIHVENVYESVLLQILDKEVTKVVKEAASLKKHNLFGDRDVASQSSRSSLSSPDSPATAAASSLRAPFEPQPPSPLVADCLKRITRVKEAPEEVGPGVGRDEDLPAAAEPSALAETGALIEVPAANVAAAPDTLVQERPSSVTADEVETAAEPEMQSTDAQNEMEVSEVPTVPESGKTDADEAAAQTEGPLPSPDPTPETLTTQQEGSSEGEPQRDSSDRKLEAPPSGEEPLGDSEPFTCSDPNSLDVSVGSESPGSDLESLEEAIATQSGDEAPTSSDALETTDSTSPVKVKDERRPQMEAGSSDAGPEEAAVSVKVESPPSDSSAAGSPLDSVKEIRNLVEEVTEVEDRVQHYPSQIPNEE
ncbi:protein Niban 1a isoform X2 [Betta splendens]|nr:protein Niban 1a isoform X2 [Betta splendens]